jgi:RHS repeat-associated protein
LWKSVRLDEVTGLLQMRNRYYSVELGRFLTRDPLGVWGDGMNLGNEVGYAGNRPLVVGDPLGLQGVGVVGFTSTGGSVYAHFTDGTVMHIPQGAVLGGLPELGQVSGGGNANLPTQTAGVAVIEGAVTIGGGISTVMGAAAAEAAAGVLVETVAVAVATPVLLLKALQGESATSEQSSEWCVSKLGGSGSKLFKDDIPLQGEPGSTVIGRAKSRRYGADGYSEVDRDMGHPDHSGVGRGPHCHDWGRPPGGGKPSGRDRGEARPVRPGDPPPPFYETL